MPLLLISLNIRTKYLHNKYVCDRHAVKALACSHCHLCLYPLCHPMTCSPCHNTVTPVYTLCVTPWRVHPVTILSPLSIPSVSPHGVFTLSQYCHLSLSLPSVSPHGVFTLPQYCQCVTPVYTLCVTPWRVHPVTILSPLSIPSVSPHDVFTLPQYCHPCLYPLCVTP